MTESLLCSRRPRHRVLSVLGLVAFLVFAGQSTFAAEGFKVNVTVDTEKPRNFMSPMAVGVQTSLSDNNLMTPDTVKMIRAAGVTALRYPGGAISGVYHWSSNKQTNWQGTDKPNFWIPPANNFGNFAALLAQTGAQAIITVNYGSNLAGTGAGEPAEAAAWVAYANGDPNDTKLIGKDSTGYDWKTVGYWATIRASQPLATDDGFNFLRIGRPQPLRIVFWEIGSDVFANGYYGIRHRGGGEVEDLHFRYGASKGESEKIRNGNRALGPVAYGENFVQFAKAMKAVDPKIRIGAALVTAKDKDLAPDWNPNVLKTVGQNANFLVMQWKPAPLSQESGWKDIDVPALLNAPANDLPISDSLMEQIGKHCAPGVQMAITDFAAPNWGNIKEPIVRGLFAAETFTNLIEAGFVNATWTDLRDGFLDGNNAPQPVWFGTQATRITMMPNDVLVATNSNRAGTLSAHAVKRTDGSFALMLVNKDPKEAASVTVTVKGMQLAKSGMRFDYGLSNPPTATGISRNQLSDLGNTFTITVPPYTITDIRVSKAQ